MPCTVNSFTRHPWTKEPAMGQCTMSSVGCLRGFGPNGLKEVAAYLQVHPQLARLIPDVCERARKEFGVMQNSS